MKLRFLTALGTFLFLMSCDKTSVYSKMDNTFENNRWASENAKTHEFTIEDDSKMYNLNLKFSHVYDYEFESVPLNIQITSPDGKEEQIPFDLKIKDASGKQLAECSGDICDLTVPLKENIKLQKGTYKITLATTFKGPYLPNVLGVGLEVKTVN